MIPPAPGAPGTASTRPQSEGSATPGDPPVAAGRPAGADARAGEGRRTFAGGRGRVAVPSLAAGAALALSLPPWGWWPLAFAGAGLLYWRLAGLRLRTRLLAGWLAGLGCFVPGLWWAKAFNVYGGAVFMGAEALALGVAAALVPPRRGRLPAYAGAFTLLEAVRLHWPFGGVPLGGVFLGQAGGPFLATARLGGPLLVTLVVWAGGAGLATLAGAAVSSRWAARWPTRWAAVDRPRRALGGGLVAVGLVAVVAGTAVLAPAGGPPIGHLSVASVQGGGRRGVSKAEVPPIDVFDAQVAATGRMTRQDGGHTPRLVLWPEDVVAVDGSLAGTAEARTVAALARRLGTTVVAGVTVTVSARHFLNEAVVWAPDGQVVGSYEKVHRVPFGEYVPDRSFFSHLANLSAVPRDAIPGHGTGLLRTPAAPLGVMISYEVFFARRGRDAVRAGARLLVVPTNTSSYATSQVPSQEVAADRFQAVEEGRTLVQAAPTGYSSVVRADGTVVRRSGLGNRQVLLATVALRDGATVFERWGDLPVLVLCGLLLAGGLAWAATTRASQTATGRTGEGKRRRRFMRPRA